ncbi:hypothetical protein OH76DRAFT_595450 [Lentinus brumalis]|uniref:Uncharacterized protein n=1 Tax=Lentinus brumalis TaxID=2498619 RepID=A0A371DUB3_9APHY|nr:hypothetical protein OH76DRAFT_595450 [Polyporus brumalis]
MVGCQGASGSGILRLAGHNCLSKSMRHLSSLLQPSSPSLCPLRQLGPCSCLPLLKTAPFVCRLPLLLLPPQLRTSGSVVLNKLVLPAPLRPYRLCALSNSRPSLRVTWWKAGIYGHATAPSCGWIVICGFIGVKVRRDSCTGWGPCERSSPNLSPSSPGECHDSVTDGIATYGAPSVQDIHG